MTLKSKFFENTEWRIDSMKKFWNQENTVREYLEEGIRSLGVNFDEMVRMLMFSVSFNSEHASSCENWNNHGTLHFRFGEFDLEQPLQQRAKYNDHSIVVHLKNGKVIGHIGPKCWNKDRGKDLKTVTEHLKKERCRPEDVVAVGEFTYDRDCEKRTNNVTIYYLGDYDPTKLRRRIEESLRKSATAEDLVMFAQYLRVKLQQ